MKVTRRNGAWSKGELGMNRRSITLVIVIIVCAVWFAYGQNWLQPRTGAEIESNSFGAHPALDQEKTHEDAVRVTPPATEPTATPKD